MDLKHIEPEQSSLDKSSGEVEIAEQLHSKDWSDDEERTAKRKLDLILMPLLTLGFFCLQLDQGNIANAITESQCHSPSAGCPTDTICVAKPS
jgi:hypothetical protein